jgi:hypothetical protein
MGRMRTAARWGKLKRGEACKHSGTYTPRGKRYPRFPANKGTLEAINARVKYFMRQVACREVTCSGV